MPGWVSSQFLSSSLYLETLEVQQRKLEDDLNIEGSSCFWNMATEVYISDYSVILLS